jgi:hypothetical protein
MKYLFRDGDSGFKEVQGEPVDKDGPFRPWALTPDGRVVYAEWKQTGSGVQSIFDLAFSGFQQRTTLRTYDKAVKRDGASLKRTWPATPVLTSSA